jgi:hypothetical protein
MVSWMVSVLLAMKDTIWGVKIANRLLKKAKRPAHCSE